MTTKATKRKRGSRFNENGLLECQRFIWQIETAAGRIEKKNKCRYSSDTRNKKKLKSSQELDNYMLLYSGVPTSKGAAAGIAILIKAKFKKRIHSYVFVNERILQLRYKLQRGYLTQSQIKHQLDATLCRFYFCRVTLHVSGIKRPSSGVLKN